MRQRLAAEAVEGREGRESWEMGNDLEELRFSCSFWL